tara:strand:+ start:785 stop:1249 length:465 start_codon:yes stop_codon:yes gene_type:complete
MLNIGQQAPEFTLMDHNSQEVSLADFKGQKVLVYFYPRASTPGCTVQACGLRDHQAELSRLNVVTLGISADKPSALAKFVDKQDLNFLLLSDVSHEVCEAYGVWQLKKFMGRENMGIVRTSFLVDEQGNLAHIFDQFKTKDHHEVVLNYLQQEA